MATSAFKSTTKRASVDASSSEHSGSASSSLRRSRSLSRFSRPIQAQPDDILPNYNKNEAREKFVDTKRRPTTQFSEISLDDLALEFFSSSSSRNENGSDGGVGDRKEREGRSVSRRGEIGRWASDTASSRRRGRSVSRSRGDVSLSSSVSRTKNVSLSDAGSRRRRSLSVARYQLSDSESEVDHSWNSTNHANLKAPRNGNRQLPLAPKATASSNRTLGRTWSHKDLSILHDGYSSHSSALTDDESKSSRLRNNGFEKIIRAVHAQKKAEHPSEDVASGELYEVMRKELRYAVEEIRTELNQAMGRSQTALTSCLESDKSESFQDFPRTKKNYSTELELLEKHKEDLHAQMLRGERGRGVSKMVKEHPDSRNSAVAEKPSRARKRSSDKHRMSKRLTEEAEKYFEDFISNVEDTDISSFDGERSDGSSTLGGTMRPRDSTVRMVEPYKSPTGSTSCPGEMDGIILPWLQCEPGTDGSLSANTKAQTPITPKSLQWVPEKDIFSFHDPSNHSTSSCASWSPSLLSSLTDINTCQTRQSHIDCSSCYDVDDYIKLRNNEELLFEMYRERSRINSDSR
ncbi:uncharacterized protein LOC105158079 isoform X2 [Sesamum indicum]|uniref:Uncharacterized protein LOC105158079 isoform X2 n=1 Tax=Sesamum indicum TaxID=4182 RepID=A0A6I9SYY7_SESIN|nr:uncharacterized protein LOC105158079 isoform X2 [Sesamum indicum]